MHITAALDNCTTHSKICSATLSHLSTDCMPSTSETFQTMAAFINSSSEQSCHMMRLLGQDNPRWCLWIAQYTMLPLFFWRLCSKRMAWAERNIAIIPSAELA